MDIVRVRLTADMVHVRRWKRWRSYFAYVLKTGVIVVLLTWGFTAAIVNNSGEGVPIADWGLTIYGWGITSGGLFCLIGILGIVVLRKIRMDSGIPVIIEG